MPDIGLITSARTSLKVATDIAKLLREGDLSLEKAELKLKLAEIMGAVAEAKIQLAEVKGILLQKDKRIGELEEAFESNDTLIRYGDAYYATNKDGKPTGIPYCLHCWEANHKKRQLVNTSRLSQGCTHCRIEYRDHRTPVLGPQGA